MPNSRYNRGRAAEYKVKAALLSDEPNSWIVRAAGSKGEADLVVIDNGTCLLVQVKSGKTKIGRTELSAFRRLVKRLNVQGAVAHVRPREEIDWIWIN